MKAPSGQNFDHDGAFAISGLDFCNQSVVIPIVNEPFKKGEADMRSKNPELMTKIKDFINQFVLSASRTPSVDEIAKGVGISKGTAHNYLKEVSV